MSNCTIVCMKTKWCIFFWRIGGNCRKVEQTLLVRIMAGCLLPALHFCHFWQHFGSKLQAHFIHFLAAQNHGGVPAAWFTLLPIGQNFGSKLQAHLSYITMSKLLNTFCWLIIMARCLLPALHFCQFWVQTSNSFESNDNEQTPYTCWF